MWAIGIKNAPSRSRFAKWGTLSPEFGRYMFLDNSLLYVSKSDRELTGYQASLVPYTVVKRLEPINKAKDMLVVTCGLSRVQYVYHAVCCLTWSCFCFRCCFLEDVSNLSMYKHYSDTNNLHGRNKRATLDCFHPKDWALAHMPNLYTQGN